MQKKFSKKYRAKSKAYIVHSRVESVIVFAPVLSIEITAGF